MNWLFLGFIDEKLFFYNRFLKKKLHPRVKPGKNKGFCMVYFIFAACKMNIRQIYF